jgi:hypothetical protein
MALIHAHVANVISGSEIAVNAGMNQGVDVGDTVTVWRTVEITDPISGDILGSVNKARIQLRVTMVADLYCLAEVEVAAPAFMSSVFGQQMKWIVSDSIVDEEHVRISAGDEVTVYTADDGAQHGR